MSIWKRITDALSALAHGEPLSEVFERLRTPPEKSVAFAIAVIALGAKMAKADGTVTKAEVAAFRDVFTIAPKDEESAARVFDLAREDVAGYEQYAKRIAAMFEKGNPVLCDLMEGLFYVAVSDRTYHPKEDDFLSHVASIFGLSDMAFRALRARFVPDAAPDPYTVLGLNEGADIEQIRIAWREAVRENHPDRMMARGVPKEAVKLAERRLIAINRAWEEIQMLQKQGVFQR
ncbi:MAG: TerB family tellurite resistance protein [Paracoccaceae bacterium]|nr:TerB family tellurite resistance protein [Paracoccaceae bacterium]